MPAILAALLLLASTTPALAASAVGCHCFRDRAFDPARPAAADPYILATSQSSLLSAVFGVEKRSLVTAKMTGTSGEDLWVAHVVSRKTGLKPDDLLDARRRAETWGRAFSALGVGPERLGPGLSGALTGPGSDSALASAAVDEVLAERFGAGAEAVRALRALGAPDGAMVVATLLHRRTDRDVTELYRRVARGGETWGLLLREAGIEPTDIDDRIRELVR